MNKDIFKGNWKQAKGKIKQAWGKLTDDELDQIEGNYDVFVGKVQEKYGYSKDEARTKVDDFMNKMDAQSTAGRPNTPPTTTRN